MQKKLSLIAIILASSLFVLHSCTKQDKIENKKSDPQKELIQAAKIFYESSSHASLNIAWDHPIFSSDLKRVSFPLIWTATFEIPLKAYRRLVISQDGKKKLSGEIIEAIPTASYFNTHPKGINNADFEGTLGAYDFEMKFKHAIYYEKGIMKYKSEIKTFPSKKAYTQTPKTEACYSVQATYYQNGVYGVVSYYYCDQTVGGPVGGGESGQDSGDRGGPSIDRYDKADPEWDGGATPPPTITDIKKDQVHDPCLSAALNLALSRGLQNEITNAFNDLFSGLDGITLTFLDGPLPKPTAGTTAAVGRFDIEITLDNSTLPKYAQEDIVATILHEAIHAMYDAKGLESGANKFTFSEYIQHNLMADRYVSKIATALQEIFPGLNDYDAKALAWGGLQKTASWNALNPVDANNLLLAADQYNDKHLKGTRCR